MLFSNLKKYFCVLFLSLIILFCNDLEVFSKNKFKAPGRGEISINKQEYEKRKKLFVKFQSLIISKLIKGNSLISIKNHLLNNFYFSSDYCTTNHCKSLIDDEFCLLRIDDDRISCRSVKNEILKKIDSINKIQNFIFILKNGEVRLSNSSGWLYIPNSDSKKYPYVDYYYDEIKQKWFIRSIRFVRTKDTKIY